MKTPNWGLVETLYQNNLDLWDTTQISKREETV